ncbi:MAG: hypothetical protein KAX10_09625, partial [Candidatus Lokiarchaeota archaeon]|nr:hypothetical protein [Candidatus Lokiarchaeota archaeon]
MADRFPPDVREEYYIVNKIREISKKYIYEEFETPLLEPIEIYAAKSSDELIYEQSFTFTSKGGDELILRP